MGRQYNSTSARRGLAVMAVVTLAVPAGAMAQDRDPASFAERFVIPPVVASGWTAPVPPGLSLRLRSDTDAIVVDGATVSTEAVDPVSGRITATLTGPRDRVAAVEKTFAVRVLPTARVRYVPTPGPRWSRTYTAPPSRTACTWPSATRPGTSRR